MDNCDIKCCNLFLFMQNIKAFKLILLFPLDSPFLSTDEFSSFLQKYFCLQENVRHPQVSQTCSIPDKLKSVSLSLLLQFPTCLLPFATISDSVSLSAAWGYVCNYRCQHLCLYFCQFVFSNILGGLLNAVCGCRAQGARHPWLGGHRGSQAAMSWLWCATCDYKAAAWYASVY